jgi:endo-1,4-beta-xylanase
VLQAIKHLELFNGRKQMISRNLLLGLIIYATLEVAVYGQPQGDTGATETESAAIVALKDAYAGKFLIGAAGDLRRYSEAELANIKTHYNILTPENSMKPQPIHPAEDRYNWATADALVQWCEENGVKVWGHTLLWHAQTGRWFFQGPDGQPASHELALERLKKHIFTVAGRYKGRVMGWDVVNEAIEDRGAGETENLRTRSWYKAIGPDVLTMAFKWAHEADPNAQLYYNDYNIEQGAVENKGKHASSMILLKRLIKEGVPIHGVGIQGHWHLDTNLADVEKAITNYASLGLKVSITELDVTATGRNSGAFRVRGGDRNIPDENYQKQAEVYGKLFEIFSRHSDVIDRVTFWGLSDRRSWRRGQDALLFDGQLKPKPAFQAVIDVASK